MRVPYVVMAAVLAFSFHQVPVTGGSDVALTGVISTGGMRLGGADESVSNHSRFLRGNNIANGDKEERWLGIRETFKQLMAHITVAKMLWKDSFSALDKVDDIAQLVRIEAITDKKMFSAFKTADTKKMDPHDLATELKKIPEADDDIIKLAVEGYTSYLRTLGK
ncbi:RxLR effector protein [Phytophthora megakarya]|uniref:RxLR effector protein n=1 Tax=Phytophthora megakarya TaxID=4795 RepID=A0A225WMF5_9STRA|nr:RxLR effector protein [Phytophthora megakarya]